MHASDRGRRQATLCSREGGEGGIRTRERACAPYSLSRRVPSATRPPLRETVDCMPRVVVLILGVLAVLLVASQLALPAIAEHQAQGRLEEGGGRADVEVKSLPALRLLFGDGDRFEAVGRGLRLDVNRRGGDFDRLD